MDDLSHGPSESPVPGSDVAGPIRYVGSGWYEVDVDGEVTKVRGEDAALQLLSDAARDDEAGPDTEAPPEPDSASEPVETPGQWADELDLVGEVFSGPVLEYRLPVDAEPGSVSVTDRDNLWRHIPVTVHGRTVRRVSGHFGRGRDRWLVGYRPA